MNLYLTELVRYLGAQSWQIAALTLVVAATTWALRHKTAHIRYLLWLIVLAKCLVPPFFAVPLKVLPEKVATPTVVGTAPVEHTLGVQKAGIATESSPPSQPPATLESGRVEQGDPPRVEDRPSRPSDLRLYAGIAWIAGAGLYLAMNLLRALRGHCWLVAKRRPLPDEVRKETEALLSTAGGKPWPPIWVIDGIGQPFVWGLLHGSIYVPSRFLEVGDREQRKLVLSHELSHVLRSDVAVNALQTVAQGLFWFHPFVWWANREIRREREKCCDEMAVACLGAKPKEYSTALVNTLIHAQELTRPVRSLAVAGPARNLEERIRTMLMPGKKFYKRPSLITASIVFLAAIVIVPTALVLTARAQIEPPKARSNSPQTLHDAAAAGDLEQVNKLLAQGADVNAKDEDGRTPLHVAAWYGRKDVGAALLARGANINEADGSGKTPLHLAADFGGKRVPEFLLAQGAQIDARDKAGNTPLHSAAAFAAVDKDLLELLIDKGADVKAKNQAGQTPLHRVSTIRRLDYPIERTAEILLAHGAEVDAKDQSGCTPLHFAVEHGNKKLVDLLVAKGADVKTKAADGTTLLHQAVKSEQLDMLELFLNQGIDVNSARSDGWTALHLALAARPGANSINVNSIVEALIARGADVKARDVRGNTPVQIAISYGHHRKDTVRLLLDKGVEVSTIQVAAYLGDLGAVKGFLERGGTVNAQDGDWRLSPLGAAALGGQKDVAAFLISHGASVNAEQEYGMTALHCAAAGGSKDVAELLIANGAKVDAKTQGGGTPLGTAASWGAKDVVLLLIDRGADVNAGDVQTRPLDAAVRAGREDVAKLLVDKGADAYTPDYLLLKACGQGDKDLVELAIQKGANVNSRPWGYPPAMEAMWSQYTNATKPADVPRLLGVLEVLLDHGADPDGKDRWDWTLLHYACEEPDLAKLLLDKGANPNVRTCGGRTPLHFVAGEGNKAATQLLLSRGADVNAKDGDGRTPLSYAADLGDNDMWGRPRKTPLTAEVKAAKKETAEVLRKHEAKE